MKRSRQNHPATVKAKAALASIRVDKTLVERAEQLEVRPNGGTAP